MIWKRVSSAGFTLIELVLVISLVGVLMVVAADRFLYWQERAEKASMESVVAAVKMGVQIRLAEMMMTNRMDARELEIENPMRWLEERPAAYAGDYSAASKPGNWYFAATEHELVYVAENHAYLETEPAGGRELRFRVAARFDATGPAGTTGSKVLSGVTVVPVVRYKWF